MTGRIWSSAKFFIVQNYTENANGNVPYCVIYLVSLSSMCAHAFSL